MPSSIPDPDLGPLLPPTEADLADLCDFMHRLAGRFYRFRQNAAPYADLSEFQDSGMAGLTYAWQTWTPALGIPFSAIAKTNMVRRMVYARRDYLTWCFPGSGVQSTQPERWNPRAECVSPSPWPAVLHAQEHARWVQETVRAHHPCFSPQDWHTLHDMLQDLDYQEIAARDHIAVKNARLRQARLLRFLRRHVFGTATTCAEEQRRVTRWPGHSMARASLAAAD